MSSPFVCSITMGESRTKPRIFQVATQLRYRSAARSGRSAVPARRHSRCAVTGSGGVKAWQDAAPRRRACPIQLLHHAEDLARRSLSALYPLGASLDADGVNFALYSAARRPAAIRGAPAFESPSASTTPAGAFRHHVRWCSTRAVICATLWTSIGFKGCGARVPQDSGWSGRHPAGVPAGVSAA
jgi:hypothetical protein